MNTLFGNKTKFYSPTSDENIHKILRTYEIGRPNSRRYASSFSSFRVFWEVRCIDKRIC